jgi:hypothetical protein
MFDRVRAMLRLGSNKPREILTLSIERTYHRPRLTATPKRALNHRAQTDIEQTYFGASS